MKIRLGTTRVVFLTKDRAYKIARIRPIRFIGHMILNIFSQKRKDHFHEKYGEIFSQYFVKDIFAGFFANIGEFEYYQLHKDARIIPTHRKYFGGFIVVQDIGLEINQDQLVKNNPLCLKSFNDRSLSIEIVEAKQYGLFNDKVVLLDYGEHKTRKILSGKFT